MRLDWKTGVTLLAGLCTVACHEPVASTAYDQTIDVQADPADVESGGVSTVLATVKEGMLLKPGVKVSFSASGGCGTLSSTSATTLGNELGQGAGRATFGQAEVTFTAKSPFASCSALITATAKTTATTLITVSPKSVTRTADDSSVPLGQTVPSVVVVPNVSMPVSDGFQATYTITANDATIDRIRIQTTQNATVTSTNLAVPPEGAASNPKDIVLIEPSTSTFNDDSLSIRSDSTKLGRLILTVTLKNPYGRPPIVLTFTDPTTHQGALPGPG